MSHPPERYTRTAIYLHWLIALALVSTFALGFYMQGLPFTPGKLQLYSWHKWAGVTIFCFVVFRLAWRLTHRAPRLPEGMARWQQIAAEAGHGLLYVLMVAVPLSGWLMSSSLGFQTVWFGVLPLPDLMSPDETWGERLLTVHKTLNYTMAALVAGHAAAALKHHFVDRDGVLARMQPRLRR